MFNNKITCSVAAVTLVSATTAFSQDWCHPQWYLAPSPNSLDEYGKSISISGDTIIVGAPGEDLAGEVDCGAIQFYFRSGDTWTHGAYVCPSSIGPGDEFGTAVGISGDSAIATAVLATTTEGTYSGRAYIYEKVNGLWVPTVSILPPELAPYDYFGSSAAIDNQTIVIGAYGASAPGSGGSFSGGIMIYDRSSGQWVQESSYTSGPAAAEDDHYGSSVAVDDPAGNTNGLIAVGGPKVDASGYVDSGAVRIFKQYQAGDGTPQWVYTTTIDVPWLYAQDGAEFGRSVAVRSDSNGNGLLAVGMPYFDGGAEDRGLVLIYRLVSGTWSYWGFLAGADVQYANFGRTLDLDGNSLIVGPGMRRYRIDMTQASVTDAFSLVGGYYPADELYTNGTGDSIDQSGSTIVVSDKDYGNGAQHGAFTVLELPSIYRVLADNASGATRLGMDYQVIEQCFSGYTSDGGTSDCNFWSAPNDGWLKVINSPTTQPGRYRISQDWNLDHITLSRFETLPLDGGTEVDCELDSIEFDLGTDPVYIRVMSYPGNTYYQPIKLTLEQVPVCAGDLNDSGTVDFNDLLVVLQFWGTNGADVDEDGTTGFSDLLVLLSHWGPCP